jgi:hypothetical protein
MQTSDENVGELLLPDYDEVRKRIESVEFDMMKYCFMATYLFAARISEVVAYRNPHDSHTTPRGPKGIDASLDSYDFRGKNEPIVLFKVRTAKRQGRVRTIGLPVNFEPWAKPLYEFFNAQGDSVVFPVNRQTAWAYAKEYFKGLTYSIDRYFLFKQHADGKTHNGKKGTITPVKIHTRDFALHALRHLRGSELTGFYGFDAFQLATYGGWTYHALARTTSVMDRYLSLSWQSYIEKLMKPRRNVKLATA